MSKNKFLLVLSSPSGGGKSTVSKYLLNHFSNLKFSVSATTRKMRPGEIDGKDYHFLSLETFKKKIAENEFVEWEEIFGNYYGTLKSEIQRAKDNNECLIFDIDVKGAKSIKEVYPRESLLVFLSPPNLESLIERLKHRNTENEEQLAIRHSRAEFEMSFRSEFDIDIINDDLGQTLKQTKQVVEKYMRIVK